MHSVGGSLRIRAMHEANRSTALLDILVDNSVFEDGLLAESQARMSRSCKFCWFFLSHTQHILNTWVIFIFFQFGSWTYSANELNLTLGANQHLLRDFISNKEWDIIDASSNRNELLDNKFSTMHFPGQESMSNGNAYGASDTLFAVSKTSLKLTSHLKKHNL